MGTSLDYISTEGFRKKLITRNLIPYNKSPYKTVPPITYEIVQSDLSVIDSPDGFIDTTFFADKLYPLNEWGTEGGFKQVPDPNGLLNTISNRGEYGTGQQNAHIIDEGYLATKLWRPLNAYSDTINIFDSAESFSSLDIVYPDGGRTPNGQPYPIFNNSSYSPVSILLSPDPQGSDGLLSSDSYIARLGAKTLKKEFEERIGRAIVRETLGRANVFSVRSGTDVLNLITGRVPLIEPNWQITITSNPIMAAADFALRLGGSIIPISTIPGSYFDTSINPGQSTTTAQLANAFKKTGTGKFFTRLLGADKTGTEIFYNNTGGGQKSRLFANINYNKYKPSYNRTLFDRLVGGLVGSTTNTGEFYIGSTTSDPSRVFSPTGELPVNSLGQEQQVPVYGPQELAQLYEGPSQEIKLGANGPTYSSGGGIEGGFTWVSPKYKGNAGKRVGVGGAIFDQDEDFKPSSYDTTQSTNRRFKEGSILDDTQRIIDSQPQGGKRLQHVGNAIDQVSKVFNDGYNEMTKGSRVLSYVGELGQEIGAEYCRAFTKDTPYLQFNDLQKEDGITTEGRRFSYSVLDKTYNLNIAPNKQEGGQSSTNIIGTTNSAYAKKYMFSLENLAWATSSVPGFSVSDLPVCERGPNGGRVMWFPPYGLTFTENISAGWNQSDFIGRPEPIYTYKNTARDGSLSWKIVVDHPSVLNLIVNKVLNNESNKTRIDGIIDSFFAGCKKYDLYQLAKKYYTINPNDLFQMQELITSKEITTEEMEYIKSTITTIPQAAVDGATSTVFGNYEKLGLYFGNDYPKPTGPIVYGPLYENYTSSSNQKIYSTNGGGTTTQFFEETVISNYAAMKELAIEIGKQLTQNTEGTVTINIGATCSAPQLSPYNKKLALRRVDSMVDFFTTDSNTKKHVESKKLLFNKPTIDTVEGEESGPSQPLKQTKKGGKYDMPFVAGIRIESCSDNDGKKNGRGDTQSPSTEVYTVKAMGCRRVYIKSITPTFPKPPPVLSPKITEVLTGNVVTKTETKPVIEKREVQRDNITKRVLRGLLSECDYFEAVKAESPMVFDNLKDKLKTFQPAFHSTTPEGLNGRLTFLQQCMRPGNTIPTVRGVDGGPTKLDYKDAVNTSFGAPPVLVMRVGDFYNTKIIPTSLALTYESLDINPEGIGIQPMIANVTLGFHFVGGSGLKESVDRLQNALTFNYYANTEIYDDRAEWTDDSFKVIDKTFLTDIGASVAPPTINQAVPNNGQTNEETIGKISVTNTADGITNGTISYSSFMDGFVKNTQTYFTTVINKNKEIFSQYNNAMRQQWMLERNYTNGKFLVVEDTDTKLFGKPINVVKRTDDIFDDLIKDIQNGNEGYIKHLLDVNKFSNKVIRQSKENYVNFIKNKKSSYQSAFMKIIQEISLSQQQYIGDIARTNVITYFLPAPDDKGSDGYQQKNGKVVPFVILATTTVDKSSVGVTNTMAELVADIIKVKTNIDEFNVAIESNTTFKHGKDQYDSALVYPSPYVKEISTNKVFIPFSKDPLFTEVENYPFRRTYMIVSNDVVDSAKYETFKNAMIGNIINNKDIIGDGRDDLGKTFDDYWNVIAKPKYIEENEITKTFIDVVEKSKLKDFLKYTPFKSKTREFTFTSENAENEAIETLIKGLGATQNQNTKNSTWNDEIDGDVYVSKIKLN